MVDDDILIYVNFIRACPEKIFPTWKQVFIYSAW